MTGQGYDMFVKAVSQAEKDIDLAICALLLASDEYPSLNLDEYLKKLDALAGEIRAKIQEENNPLRILTEINRYLFDEEGFRGNTSQYYDPKNSFLNDVLDRKMGIPITLSLVYMEVGKRVGIELQGVGFPGHFIVKYRDKQGEFFLDPFNSGRILQMEDLQKLFDSIYGGTIKLEPEHLRPSTKKEIIRRMLANLKGIYVNANHYDRALAVTQKILAIVPDEPDEIRDLGLIRLHLGQNFEAIEDLERYLQLRPNASDAAEVFREISELKGLIEKLRMYV